MVRRECEKAFLPEFVNEETGGYSAPQINKRPQRNIDTLPDYAEYTDKWTGDKIFKIGIVSDTHLGSTYQQLTHLNTAYDTFQREGITDVLHAGDVSEGISSRKNQINERFLHGADQIIEYILENYPRRKGIKTRFVSGNHDLWLMDSAGVDVCQKIGNNRDDMEYLGKLNARINITPNCVIELSHPLDRGGGSVSLSPQKAIDVMDSAVVPDIYICGHYHKHCYVVHKRCHALSVPCFQSMTTFIRGVKSYCVMGFFILTIHVDEKGAVKRFQPEYFPFYDWIDRDY